MVAPPCAPMTCVRNPPIQFVRIVIIISTNPLPVYVHFEETLHVPHCPKNAGG